MVEPTREIHTDGAAPTEPASLDLGVDGDTGHEDSDGAWIRLVAEWFEEQSALLIAELERGRDG